MAAVVATLKVEMFDDGHIEIELNQQDHLYTQEALTIARLALDDVLAHLVNEKMGKAIWSVDWPNL